MPFASDKQRKYLYANKPNVAKKLAKQEGIAESGFRLIMNCNQDGGQEVYHIHLHLLGGKKLGKLL